MGMDARETALAALERCRRDGAWSGAVLDTLQRQAGLEPRDSALAAQLCLGVLQNSLYLDYVIACFYQKKLEPRVRDILRLGAYQLLYLDRVPARAAVNETVALCDKQGCGRAKGLCNALLRRIAEQRENPPEIREKDPALRLSLRYSHPEWLVRLLLEEHDEAFVEGFLRENNRPAPLTVQVNRLKANPSDYCRALERRGILYEADEAIPGCLTLPAGGAVQQLPGFEEGLFFVQDRAARSAVHIAGIRPGMQVLDACAAPGGKSFSAAMDLQGQGRIISRDIQEKKLRRLQSGAERLGIDCIQTEARDARVPDPVNGGRFDVVMTDVPCSGLGVIRKRPEIRYKTREELSGLPPIQAEILEASSRLVKPGGVLLYSTCTVLERENQEQITSFLRRHREFRTEGFSLGRRNVPEGQLCFWPQTDGCDGFFVCKMRRTEG